MRWVLILSLFAVGCGDVNLPMAPTVVPPVSSVEPPVFIDRSHPEPCTPGEAGCFTPLPECLFVSGLLVCRQ